MASIIKADNIQKVSDGTNIIKKCGSTITLGSTGATIALACGASQTGFGRTGTVDWCTTAKTAPFTGVSGKGYFVNTTCGAVTVTLPATPTAGDIISVADYASNWATNSVTLCRNSSKINGACLNATLNTAGQSITLVYVDSTRGWKNTMDSTSNITGAPNFIVATGGTVTTCGNYKIHTFTADGCFSISSAPTPANNNVDYLVVAGGGGSPADKGGGGGAGGYRESHTVPVSGCYTASPLASGTSLPVSIQSYPITIGAGGPANTIPSGPSSSVNGSGSSFSSITSAGGGGGGEPGPTYAGGAGGSGGGSRSNMSAPAGGAGNTPPVSPPQGNPGGNTGGPAAAEVAGGGGGATTAGSNGSPGQPPGTGAGGTGATTSISGTPTAYAGGGGGGGAGAVGPASPCGTGGKGANSGNSDNADGTTNRGGGAGGGGTVGRAGGSGIVIIRYRYQ